MRNSLPRRSHAATRQCMKGRIASLLVLIGLFFGVVAMPAIAHANGDSAAHASEVLDVHEANDADHTGSQGADKDIPCHTVSHHHCSVALHLDGPSIVLNGLTKNALLRPAAATTLTSRSQAPPLDPPLA